MTQPQVQGSKSVEFYRSREDFMARGGLAFGLPLGALGYEAGGWLFIGIGFALVAWMTVALAARALWREYTR